MKKKKGITLITGVLSIGCLFCAYGLLKTENVQKEKEAEAESSKPILNLDIDNPVSLRFKIGEQEVEFSYANGVWSKTDDDTFPVNGEVIEEVLTDLAEVSAVRTLEDVEDLSEYGFDAPKNSFIYTDGSGNTVTLTIGTNNESTGDDYLLVDTGEEAVYTISTTLRSSISTELYDYASSEELPVLKEENIQSVSVAKEDESYRLCKEGETWYVESEKGESLLAEEETVESELGTLSYSLAYSDFVEHNCADASEYGIDEDAAVFIVSYTQADEAESTETEQDSEETEDVTNVQADVAYQELKFLIGSTDEEGNYYVQKDGSKEVHTISAEVLTAFLDGTAGDWEAEPETETEMETEENLTEEYSETVG